jgi:hypothetical protein
MRFIETNKHRLIEKNTMELAMSWYYRYIEKEEQIEKIERNLIEFEQWLYGQNDTISMAELQKAWSRSVKL